MRGDYLTDPATPKCYVRWIVDHVGLNYKGETSLAVKYDDHERFTHDTSQTIWIDDGWWNEESKLLVPVWRDGVQIWHP